MTGQVGGDNTVQQILSCNFETRISVEKPDLQCNEGGYTSSMKLVSRV